MFEFLNKKNRQKLEAQVASLTSQLETAEDRVTRAESSEKDAQIKLTRKDTYYKGVIEDIRSIHEVEVNTKNRSIEVLEADLEDAVDSSTRDIQSKADKKLEDDKASYRKYLKTELNTKIDGLEKEVKKLAAESATATGQLAGANATIEILKGQLGTMSTITDKILNALPEVSANITTPNFQAPAVKKEENKGEQKK